MSIRFNHASNKITSTNTATIVIEGGTPTAPRPLRLDASSIIFPNKNLPLGEAGAVVFDIASSTLKYHNGFKWIEVLGQDDILAPVNISLTDIYNQLANRVKTVTYSTSSVPSAAVSGTNLNIVFPSSTSSQPTVPGLFTSSPPGSIMQYSLISGQSVESIREQMSGVSGGQAGRNGSASAPFVTKTGWCFSDGYYWAWNGEGGTVIKQVPNLNQNAYLKSITTSGGVTKTDSVIVGSGSISNTSINMPQHYHGTGMMLGLSGSTGDDASFIFGKTWNDGNTYYGVNVSGNANHGQETSFINGSDTRTALSTSYAIYPNGNSTTHTHSLTGVDVEHFNVAVLYNIAEPATALNQTAGDLRYVLKTGDTMSGSLSIANSATIQSNDTNVVLWFRNSSGAERGVIYHSSTTNTLRFRTGSGAEMALSSTGGLSVSSLTATNINGSTLGITGAASTGALSVNGQITGSSLNIPGTGTIGALTVNGQISGASLNIGGAASTGALTANGQLYGWTLVVPGAAAVGQLSSVGQITGSSISVSGQVSGATLNIPGAANTGVLNVNGQITATGDIWAFSDAKLKENIIEIANPLDIIEGITGVTGNMIGETKERSMVIAQDVLEVFPTVVDTDENGMLKVNYIGLIPVLINSINELRKEIEELKGRNV